MASPAVHNAVVQCLVPSFSPDAKLVGKGGVAVCTLLVVRQVLNTSLLQTILCSMSAVGENWAFGVVPTFVFTTSAAVQASHRERMEQCN